MNITTSAYGYYEQGKRSPDTDVIKKLADFFNVSTDYLLGQVNTKENRIITLPHDKAEEKIRQVLIDENIIAENEVISELMLERILKYGIEAAVEIFKLEKKLGDLE